MKKIITKKVYRITLECKQKNKYAEEDGITFGLKIMDDCFLAMVSSLQMQRKTPWSMAPSKSRKVDVELLSEE